MEKIYYKQKELVKLGYPKTLVEKVARKVNRKSKPEAERGFHYLLTIKEVEKEL